MAINDNQPLLNIETLFQEQNILNIKNQIKLLIIMIFNLPFPKPNHHWQFRTHIKPFLLLLLLPIAQQHPVILLSWNLLGRGFKWQSVIKITLQSTKQLRVARAWLDKQYWVKNNLGINLKIDIITQKMLHVVIIVISAKMGVFVSNQTWRHFQNLSLNCLASKSNTGYLKEPCFFIQRQNKAQNTITPHMILKAEYISCNTISGMSDMV